MSLRGPFIHSGFPPWVALPRKCWLPPTQLAVVMWMLGSAVIVALLTCDLSTSLRPAALSLTTPHRPGHFAATPPLVGVAGQHTWASGMRGPLTAAPRARAVRRAVRTGSSIHTPAAAANPDSTDAGSALAGAPAQGPWVPVVGAGALALAALLRLRLAVPSRSQAPRCWSLAAIGSGGVISVREMRESRDCGHVLADPQPKRNSKPKPKPKPKSKRRKRRCQEDPKEHSPNLGRLSDEQTEVLTAVIDRGESVFLTGNAGTGKTFLLRVIIHELQMKLKRKTVVVTASTGIAAGNIGGVTLHSFAGVKFGNGSPAALVGDMRSRNRTLWKRAKVLVIDEVSMVDGNFLDTLDKVAQLLRNDSEKPFGGLQVVLCGDFFQLPPVSVNRPLEAWEAKKGVGWEAKPVKFAFEADCWERITPRKFVLRHVYRQSEQQFLTLLDEVRHGRLSADSVALLDECMRKPEGADDGIQPTQLFSKNEAADEVNQRELARLGKEVFTHEAQDEVMMEGLFGEGGLDRWCPFPKTVDLAVGAQVLLLKNMNRLKPAGLVNGALGIVTRFSHEEDGGRLPFVKFKIPASVNEEHELLIKPEKWTCDFGEETVAERTQLPLRLAWAMTIHKSQGMTIPKLQVSLKDVFEPGMAYVALSRVTCLEGLQLRDYDIKNIRAHPQVERYYWDDPVLKASMPGPPDPGAMEVSEDVAPPHSETRLLDEWGPQSQQSQGWSGVKSQQPQLVLPLVEVLEDVAPPHSETRLLDEWGPQSQQSQGWSGVESQQPQLVLARSPTQLQPQPEVQQESVNFQITPVPRPPVKSHQIPAPQQHARQTPQYGPAHVSQTTAVYANQITPLPPLPDQTPAPRWLPAHSQQGAQQWSAHPQQGAQQWSAHPQQGAQQWSAHPQQGAQQWSAHPQQGAQQWSAHPQHRSPLPQWSVPQLQQAVRHALLEALEAELGFLYPAPQQWSVPNQQAQRPPPQAVHPTHPPPPRLPSPHHRPP